MADSPNLTKAELEDLLRDVAAAGFGERTAIVESILRTAIADAADADKWRAYRQQNRAAQKKYRQKAKGLDPARLTSRP